MKFSCHTFCKFLQNLFEYLRPPHWQNCFKTFLVSYNTANSSLSSSVLFTFYKRERGPGGRVRGYKTDPAGKFLKNLFIKMHLNSKTSPAGPIEMLYNILDPLPTVFWKNIQYPPLGLSTRVHLWYFSVRSKFRLSSKLVN